MASGPSDAERMDWNNSHSINYAKKAMTRRSGASSLNSTDIRNGKHGVMAKFKYTVRMRSLTLILRARKNINSRFVPSN